MTNNHQTIYSRWLFSVLFLCTVYIVSAQVKVPFTPRLGNSYINIKGDYTFLANGILNRVNNNHDANDPYNGNANNNGFHRDYIDIDGDPSTFSSSSSTLSLPSCSRIYYAGLYWAGNYKQEVLNNSNISSLPGNDTRRLDFTAIKLKVPRGNYVDIVADNDPDPVGEEDDIIYDNVNFTDSPYVCYKNVTKELQALADPQGEYTVANVRATRGKSPGGAGGWTLVVIYENPTMPGRYISTFDGYSAIRSGNSSGVNFDISGFNTIPSGPVRARLGANVLEGDRSITGDQFKMKAFSKSTFTSLSNPSNPVNNFFNSNITIDGSNVTTRNIASTNTLGYDSDIFDVANPANSLIGNNETGATFRLITSGDTYSAFLMAFSVEIIEPKIILEKRVEDIAGNDITGLGVNLGQTLDYVLSYKNVGNDDGTNYTLRDVLPANVVFDRTNLILPTGVSYVYDAPSHSITFSVPDNLIEVGDPFSSIRMRVKVAENCFDFVDACSAKIQNVAYSTYKGVINDNQISDDPSVTLFDSCGFVTPGATNFLLDDLSDCTFVRKVQLCGDNALLDAGNGFDNYVWYKDENGNNVVDPSDTVLNDGDPDNDPSTLSVDNIGTYIVDKQIADPCKGFKEIIKVERFGATQTNPIVDFFNDSNSDADPNNDVQGEIVSCSIDGDLLPKIFLCGSNDSQTITLNITDAQSLVWEKLVEGSCTPSGDDCGNKNGTCTWNQVGNGNSFVADSEGKYRLVINYQNGCSSRFYFNVFQNNLDIQYDSSDIICTAPGNITINPALSGYGYQLYDVANNTIVIPFSANNGPSFDIATNGAYRVDMVQLDNVGVPIDGACIFSTPDIGIRDRDFQVDITTIPANCNTLGKINIQALNVEPNYSYELRLDDGSNGGLGSLIDDETANPDNNFSFENLNPGNYIVITKTEDGCSDTQNIAVGKIPDLTLTALTVANIGCTDGTIRLTAGGGYINPNYLYAIWSKDGIPLYMDISDIPASAYQIGDRDFTFASGEDGDYTFMVVDANNCYKESNTVTIENKGTPAIDATNTPIVCSGSSTANLTIAITGGVGPFKYSIDNGTSYQNSNKFVNLAAGSYTLRVTDASGCDVSKLYTITEPFTLSASVGVTEVLECNPVSNSAKVRITNAQGGTAPYSYSFDGGANFGPDNFASLPKGTHNVAIQDDNGCIYPMTVTVPNPVVKPDFSYMVDYNCDGTGNITVNSTNTTDFNYTYDLIGTPNGHDTNSNIFNNVAVGSQTISISYASNIPPVPSDLLLEDFGAGPNTAIAEIDPAYCYEPQNGSPSSCAQFGANALIQDGEYSVTQRIVRPYSSWLSPNDHTGNANGRFLAINVGGVAGIGGIVYAKRNIEVMPNRDITISLWAFNLLKKGRNGGDPSIEIQLVNRAGTIIASTTTGNIPKNNGANDWQDYTVKLNPGAAINLDIVIRTNSAVIYGNDIAIDDIQAFQLPRICPISKDLVAVVGAGKAFEANILSYTDPTCSGLVDGSIKFEVENFNATSGFEYSINGGAYISSLTSPVTISTGLVSGTNSIEIRKVDDSSCTTTLTQDLTAPTAVVANAAITTQLTCTNGGATITASATGGTPGYQYQLEDTSGGVITPYQTSKTFTGLTAGDYIIHAKDIRGCDNTIDSSLTVNPPSTLTFTALPTACYSGNNDGAIVVDVTGGNGNLLFSLNGGPYVAPSPTTASTYTFDNLGSGSYTIDVKDGFGCPGMQQTVSIAPKLNVTATAEPITACASDTNVMITAIGGDNNYVYAIVANGVAPQDSDFLTTNTITVSSGAGDYDVYVRDHNGNTGYCQTLYDINIIQNEAIVLTADHTDVMCTGNNTGSISMNATGGTGVYTYSIDGGTTYQPSGNFTNLDANTYAVVVKDSDDCETTDTIIITAPASLGATATASPYTCAAEAQITVDNVTGGSLTYQYRVEGETSWLPSVGTTTTTYTFTQTFTDGAYTVQVRDFNSPTCSFDTAVTIDPLPAKPVLASSIAYNCDGTGNITITPNDPAYTYAIDGNPSQPSNQFTNIAVGNHTVVVKYGSECITDISMVVASGKAFTASITATKNITCFGDTNGEITLTAKNFGASGFEYRVGSSGGFTGPFTTTQTLPDLTAQAYSIEVRDVDNPTGCTITLNPTLSQPNAIVASASITTPFTCNNTGATITASATGGTPTYTYSIDGGANYQATPIFNNVGAGTYTIIAKDSNGCQNDINAPITISTPRVPVFTATGTTCYSGANDGSITVNVTAGNGDYKFKIDGGAWMTPTPATATTYTFDNLANGSHTIDVNDGYGCAGVQQTFNINAQLTATIDVSDISSCADGSITVNATGGNGNLQYAYVLTTNNPTGLFTTSNTFVVTTGNEGTYDVYVRDHNANATYCEYKETVTVNPATPLVFTATGTSPQCHDEKGSIALSITSGTAPFKVELLDITNGTTPETLTNFTGNNKTFYNLDAVDYKIRVTDAKGCPLASATTTLTNPDALAADIDPILPSACTGVSSDFGFQFKNYPTTLGIIQFSADGGTTWTGNNSNPGTSDRFMGYPSGTIVYPSLRTVDGSNNTICQLDLPRYIIPYPLDDLNIDINAIVVNCNDLQVTVQGTAGVAPYEYTYSEDPANFNTTSPIIPWTTQTAGNHVFTGLVPGRTYIFYVRDSSGCVRQSTINVNDLAPPPILASGTIKPSCNGQTNGEIKYTVTESTPGSLGGSFYWELFELGNASAINTGTVGSFTTGDSFTVIGLAKGEYYVEITGNAPSNCKVGSENVKLNELKPITGTPNTIQDITCANPGLIEIQNPTGGGGTYIYKLSSTNFNADISSTHNPIEISLGDLADATVTPFDLDVSVEDQFGCPQTLGTVSINVAQKPTIGTIAVTNCTAPFSITVPVSGGVGPYLYSIDGGVNYVDNGGVFNNVAIGSYNISVIDSNGCSDTAASATNVYPALQATASITKLLDCSATPNADITIKATDGSGSYDYMIDGPGAVDQVRTALPSPANEVVWSSASVAGTYSVSVYDNNTTCPPRTFTVEVGAAITPQFMADATDITCNASNDGTITVTATDNGTGPYTFEITALDGAAFTESPASNTATTATFTGLAPTTTATGYVVRATGANDCTTDVSNIVISQPATIAVTLDPVVEFACTTGNADNNAVISVANTTGGSGTYVRYEFINDANPGVPVQNGANPSYTETNTAGGNYTINVYDDKGCMGTETATITPFVALTNVAATPTNPSCNPGNDGQVQVDVSLAPGLGSTNLRYDIATTGFTDTFSGNTATHSFTGLGIGNYLITVTNIDTDCVVQTTAELQNPNTFDIDVDVTGDVVCFGSSTGAVEFSITDATYTAGFNYQVFKEDTNTAMTGVFNQPDLGPSAAVNLPAGDYYVIITQDNNPTCSNRENFSIAGPTAAITANTKVTPITCNPTNNGIIEITDAIGGWGGYQYYVGTTPPSGAGDYVTSPKFENLSANTYEAWIRDAKGCEEQVQNNLVLADPTPITADLLINTKNCSNFEGEIQVANMLGGKGSNYSYQLQKFDGSTFVDERPIQTSTTFSGLGAGEYQVIVSDQWGCSASTANTIELYDEIVPLATIVKAIDCTVDPGGQITISQTGGSGTYAYGVEFPDGATTANNTGIFTGLTQDGEYTFTITDGTCSKVIKKSLAPRVEPVLNIDSYSDITCSGDTDGTITVTANDNGVGPYTFEITSVDGTALGTPIAPTSNTSTSATFTGLSGSIAGTKYTVTATAANTCATTIDQTLLLPEAITNVNASVDEFGCSMGNNPNNATITIDATAISGGSGTYVRYEFINDANPGTPVQNGTSPKYVETNVLGGNYTINVYDDKGCSGTTTATIVPFIKISDPVVTLVTDVTCTPGDDAKIQVGVTITGGGTSNLKYTVTGVGNAYDQNITSTNNLETFTGLGVGNYSISIANTVTGCVVETSYEIKEPNIIEAVATKLTDEACLNNGTDDGSFQVDVTKYPGGTYTYQVFDLNNNPVTGRSGSGNATTPLVISGLPGGGYYVKITETAAPFCVTTSNAVAIIAPQSPITSTISEEANVSCTNDQGAILVDPEGGAGPYTILLENNLTSQSYTQSNVEAYLFNGLSGGNFDVTVTDANGCDFTDTITLVAPIPIVASITPDFALTCFGNDNGVISATVTSGGFGTFQYQLNVYDPTGAVIAETSALQPSNTFTNLSAGIYSITISDKGNCGRETDKMIISDPTDVQGSLIRTSPLTCMTQADLLLTASGGTGPYSYSVDGTSYTAMAGGNTQTFSVDAGTYQYYIKDSFGCTSILSNAISEDPIEPLTLDVDESAAIVNCNGESSAAIYAKANGGLGNYRYELFSDAALTMSVAGPNATGNFKDLVAGDYYVQVTSVDCTLSSNVVHILQPDPLSVTDDFANISCNGANDGTITVELSGGSGGYQYAISPNLNRFYSENSFTDLASGNYTVIAQDKNGCFVVLDYTLTEPTVLDIMPTVTPEICAGSEDGTISLVISGGTAPYSTSLNSNNAGDYVQGQMAFSGLAAGTYMVFVKDDHGCDSNIVVDIAPGANLNAVVKPVYECSGDTPDNHINVTLEDDTVAADVLYALDSTDPNDMQLAADFTNMAPGKHYLAIGHGNGCVNTIDFNIKAFDPLTLILEQNNINEITAIATGGKEDYTFHFGNLDNGNDNTFIINKTGTYTVTVTDKNGCEASADIFIEFIDIEIPNFFTPDGDGNNDLWKPKHLEAFPKILMTIFDRYGREIYRMGANDPGWKGIYQESKLPSGDYWYIIKLNGEADDREFTGHFTLYR